jgi:hypothetical protein
MTSAAYNGKACTSGRSQTQNTDAIVLGQAAFRIAYARKINY